MRTILTALAALLGAGVALPAAAAPAMWEVSDADSRVWLFGSVHLLPEGAQWRTAAFDKILARADKVYFETDVGPLGAIAMSVKVLSLAAGGHKGWVQPLTPQQRAKLQKALVPLGLTVDGADLYPPWVIALQIDNSRLHGSGVVHPRPALPGSAASGTEASTAGAETNEGAAAANGASNPRQDRTDGRIDPAPSDRGTLPAQEGPGYAGAVQGDGGPTRASKVAFGDGVDIKLEWELPPERKLYFETPGEQFDFLGADPIPVQVRNLFADIDVTGNAGVDLQQLVTHWQAGDVDFIAATIRGTPDDEPVRKRILFDRNANWLPRIEAALAANQQDLIVVGAAHLAGDGSVLDLLAKAGYTVRRIQ